jgi:hypothetical protein
MLTSYRSNVLEDYNYVELGKQICLKNNFYNTLKLLLKYYFLYDKKDINMLEILREVSKNEMEFKTFMIYKNFAIDIYHKFVKDNFKDNFKEKEYIMEDDIIYTIIYFVKEEYDKDHSIIRPYITNVDKDDVVEKFNLIKANYQLRSEVFEKFSKLEEAIRLLEESKILENKAKISRNKALNILNKIHKSMCNFNYEPKLLE